jgi:hypothetical protein
VVYRAVCRVDRCWGLCGSFHQHLDRLVDYASASECR